MRHKQTHNKGAYRRNSVLHSRHVDVFNSNGEAYENAWDLPKSIFIPFFNSASPHQALAGSAPRLSMRVTSVLPKQITKQQFFG